MRSSGSGSECWHLLHQYLAKAKLIQWSLPKWPKFSVSKNSACTCFATWHRSCPPTLYNTWPHSPLNDPCCYLLLLLFMFTNSTWIRSALEWNSDTSTGCLSLTLVNDTYRRPFTISWALSGNMESRTSLRILEMSKLGCNGPRALERAFVASRSTKLVHSPNRKKWHYFDILHLHKPRPLYYMNIQCKCHYMYYTYSILFVN